ncbi:response regulator [Gordonia sp. SID5947]|uniref:response regulator n=1 Tax=Gordonia sp. SID5947 TaxID=2690315 RepID=UPI0013705882|nr:response regulator transcription factor [Gordonia sp. SID5947]MYR07926.1 response regulator [Gordonia sp. SID5947]
MSNTGAPGPVRVVIVDDEALIRSGFEMILDVAADIEVVATASSSDALATIATTDPDVVLLDIRMPPPDGLAILEDLRRRSDTRPAIAMLTTFHTDEYVLTALRNGASGFLLKDSEPTQLAQSVRTLAAGGVVLSSPATAALLRSRRASSTEEAAIARVALLTPRERDVVVWLATGLTNAQIADELYLSTGTIKDHVSAALTKLRVGSRVEAALVAQRAGLLDTE